MSRHAWLRRWTDQPSGWVEMYVMRTFWVRPSGAPERIPASIGTNSVSSAWKNFDRIGYRYRRGHERPFQHPDEREVSGVA